MHINTGYKGADDFICVFGWQHMLEEVLCEIEVDLDGRCTTVRREECILGNLITNAMLEATHADVALLNSGRLIISKRMQFVRMLSCYAIAFCPCGNGVYCNILLIH